MSEDSLKKTLLTKQQVLNYSVSLKLPESIILRVNDLLVYVSLDTGPKKAQVERAYRLALKKRYYVKCVRDYLHLFKGMEGGILGAYNTGGLSEPYIYNSSMSEPFAREEESKEPTVKGSMT